MCDCVVCMCVYAGCKSLYERKARFWCEEEATDHVIKNILLIFE